MRDCGKKNAIAGLDLLREILRNTLTIIAPKRLMSGIEQTNPIFLFSSSAALFDIAMAKPASPGAANLLLAALDANDYALIGPHLKNVNLTQNDVLHEPGARIQHVYFPLSAMISLLAVLESGLAIEIAAIGREGAIGTTSGPRSKSAFARAVV